MVIESENFDGQLFKNASPLHFLKFFTGITKLMLTRIIKSITAR